MLCPGSVSGRRLIRFVGFSAAPLMLPMAERLAARAGNGSTRRVFHFRAQGLGRRLQSSENQRDVNLIRGGSPSSTYSGDGDESCFQLGRTSKPTKALTAKSTPSAIGIHAGIEASAPRLAGRTSKRAKADATTATSKTRNRRLDRFIVTPPYVKQKTKPRPQAE